MERHESFGVLTLSKVYSNHDQYLFGSSIPHQNVIRIELRKATLERRLNNDWIYPKEQLACIDFSPSQWAEFVSSIGDASGVPCTIRYVDGKKMEECPYESKRAQFDAEFTDTLKGVTSKLEGAIAEVQSLMDKKTVTKADRESIQKALDSVLQDLNSNIPFIKAQFSEQMDRTVLEAKGEVDAFLQHKVKQLMQLEEKKAE